MQQSQAQSRWIALFRWSRHSLWSQSYSLLTIDLTHTAVRGDVPKAKSRGMK
jgi:hypothetical protein